MSQGPSQNPTGSGGSNQGVNKTNCLVEVAEGLYYDKCRSYYSPAIGYGRLVLSVEGDREYVIEVKTEDDKTYLSINIDGVPYAIPLSRIRRIGRIKSLANLAPYQGVIESLVYGLVGSASERIAKYVPTVASREIQVGNDRLFVGIKADGSIVLKFGGNIARADDEGGLARALAQLLPPNVLSQYGQTIASEVKKFIEDVANKGYIKVGDMMVSTEENEIYMLYNTVIVGDKMVMLIPVNATVLGSNTSRDSIPILVITSDSNGNTQLSMAVGSPRSPVEVSIGGKTVVRDFFSQFSSARDIRQYLPDGRLIKYVMMYLNQPPSLVDLMGLVTKYIDKYVELQEREHELARLFAIAQVFYDVIRTYPLIGVMGEKGSGKRQFSNAMASLMPIYIRTGDVTPAILYRLTTALAPALVLDETESTLRENPELLNMGYEADILVQRARPTEAGYKIESFVVYGPKYVVGKPTTLKVREDVESRMVYFNMLKSKKYYPPVDLQSDERYNIMGALLAFKARYWRVFRDTYDMLKRELTYFDQRYVDDYLPALTIAYMENDKCVFYNVLMDMVRNYMSRRENVGFLSVVVYGILGKLVTYGDTYDGVVREVAIKPKEVVDYASKYLPLGGEGGVIDDDYVIGVGKYLARLYRIGESFVIGRREGRDGTVYTIDLVLLYEYVSRYDVDLSLMPMSELVGAEKLTGLRWSAVSNNEKWVLCVLNRLFHNGPPVMDCMGSNIDLSQVQGEFSNCRLWGQARVVSSNQSEEKVSESATMPQPGRTNQQVMIGGTGGMPQESHANEPPPSGGESNTIEVQAQVMTGGSTNEPYTPQPQPHASQANPPSGGGSVNVTGPEPQTNQPPSGNEVEIPEIRWRGLESLKKLLRDEELNHIIELSVQCRRKYLIEKHDFEAYKECMHNINLEAGPVPEPPSELVNTNGELGREVANFVRDFLWFKYVVEEEVRNLEEYGAVMASLKEDNYHLVQEGVNRLFARVRTKDDINIACKAICWVTHSHYDYENCLARCSQCSKGDMWDAKWADCRRRDKTPGWLKTSRDRGGES